MSANFGDLANAPVTDGYFQFKFEKNWARPDVSAHNELFSLDMKVLSTVVNCIPFNEYLQVEDQYFTKDQLTYLNTNAEQSSEIYKTELAKNVPSIVATKQTMSGHTERTKYDDNTEEDLDFLLSLKEPVQSQVPVNVTIATPKSKNNDPTFKAPAKETKSIDLEKWLDSVLDD